MHALNFVKKGGGGAKISFFEQKDKKVRRPGIKPGSGPWQGPILSLNYRRYNILTQDRTGDLSRVRRAS